VGVCVARRGRQCTQESLHPLLFERYREGKSTVGHKGARFVCSVGQRVVVGAYRSTR
jgi:hypothetical protein